MLPILGNIICIKICANSISLKLATSMVVVNGVGQSNWSPLYSNNGGLLATLVAEVVDAVQKRAGNNGVEGAQKLKMHAVSASVLLVVLLVHFFDILVFLSGKLVLGFRS